MIVVRSLTKRYGPVTAVDGVSFEVRAGEVFGLLGPNGAGKTTILEILAGLRRPDAGLVEVLGHRVPEQREAIRGRVGVQLHVSALYPRLRVRELVELFAQLSGKKAASKKILEESGLEELAHRFVARLSQGEFRRLLIALALLQDPEVVLLDEPTAGLDPHARRWLRDVVAGLRTRGRTVVLTTHYIDEAERLCDRVAIMHCGRILAIGQPRALIQEYTRGATLRFPAGPGVRPEAWERLPGVTRCHRELDGQVTIVTADLPATLREMIGLLESERLPLDHLTIRPPSLEDVFFELTGSSLS